MIGKEIKNKNPIRNNSPEVSIDSELGELDSKLPQDEQPIIPGPEVGDDRRPDIPIYDSNNLTKADNTKFIKENYADVKHQYD